MHADDEECRVKFFTVNLYDFAYWVNNNELLPNSHLPSRSISSRTACKWMNDLGFHPMSYRKGVYVDVQDLVDYRKLYLF